jgi:hypothetical protein
MRKKEKNALDTFVRDKHLENVCYGFVLRQKPGTGSNACDYIIETNLMKFIRKVVYDFPHGKDAITFSQPEHRVHYFTLRAILVPEFRVHFLSVFPQYEKWYTWCDNMLNNITNKVISAHIGSKNERTTPTIEEVTARQFMEKIRSEKININSAHTESIIGDFVRDPRNTELLYMCIASVRDAQKH